MAIRQSGFVKVDSSLGAMMGQVGGNSEELIPLRNLISKIGRRGVGVRVCSEGCDVERLVVGVEGGTTSELIDKLKANPILYLASSRLPKNWTTIRPFRNAVAAVADQFVGKGLVVLCPETSSIFPMMEFLSFRNRWDFISVAANPKGGKVNLPDPGSVDGRAIKVRVSFCDEVDRSHLKIPVQDFFCFMIADEIRALFIRSGGGLQRLVERFSEGEKRIFGLCGLPKEFKQSWLLEKDRSIIRWMVKAKVEGEEPARSPVKARKSSAKVLPWPKGGMSGFLAHHTRGTCDQWPRDHAFRYWEKWLRGDGRDGTSLQTLEQILGEQRLRGSGRFIFENRPMVCFSDRDPMASSRSPIYRKHLRRWDWLPFGVGVSKEVLFELGCQAVEYVEARQKAGGMISSKDSEEAGPHRSVVERSIWRQPRFSFDRDGKVKTDWSQEREFRLEGDLDLRLLSPDQAYIFVDSFESAQRLAKISRFPCYYFETK